VLGVKIMDGRGEVLSFGGQVMKNVAGYDVSRLMAGSLGTLAIILEASLKALPVPMTETTLELELPEDKAIETLNKWAAGPFRSARAPGPGARSGCASRRECRGGRRAGKNRRRTRRPRARRTLLDGIREQTDPFFRNNAPLWRISVPSAAPRSSFPASRSSSGAERCAGFARRPTLAPSAKRRSARRPRYAVSRRR